MPLYTIVSVVEELWKNFISLPITTATIKELNEATNKVLESFREQGHIISYDMAYPIIAEDNDFRLTLNIPNFSETTITFNL